MSTTVDRGQGERRSYVEHDPRLQAGAYLAHDRALYRNCGRLDHNDDPLAGAWLIENARSVWDEREHEWVHQTDVVSTFDLLNEDDPYILVNRTPWRQWRQ